MQDNNSKDSVESLAIPLKSYDGVAAETARLAESRGIQLSDEAEWRLVIKDETEDTWQASTTQNLDSEEFYLTLSVVFQLYHQGEALEPVTIKRQAIYRRFTGNHSASEREKQDLSRQLKQDVAMEVLRQTLYIVNHPPDCDCNHEDQASRPQPAA